MTGAATVYPPTIGCPLTQPLTVRRTSLQVKRLLNHIPVDAIPEGIEFTADGSKLFVQTTLANHIMVFDVDGMNLRRLCFALNMHRRRWRFRLDS